jgi:PAS domain S-box-containing protein
MQQAMDSRLTTPRREDVLLRVFQESSQGIAISRLEDATILQANDAFGSLVGRSVEELVGMTATALGLFSEIGEERALRLLREQGTIDGFDAQVRLPSGKTRILRLWAEVVQGHEPLVVVRTSHVDARMVDAAYNELREAEMRCRALIERAAALIYVEVPDESCASGSRATYVSPYSIELLGYTPDELIADPALWDDMVHPDDRERLFAETNEVELNGRPFRHEYRVVRKDGETRWVRDDASLIEDSATGSRFWQGFMLDITEQRDAQEQQTEAEAKFRNLVEATPAITYMDRVKKDDPADVTPAYISPQLEAVLGYTPEEWLADEDSWGIHVHPEDRVEAERVLDQARVEGGPGTAEYRMVAKDGRVVWIRENSVLIRDEAGNPEFWQGVMLDITARKEAEEALHGAEAKYRTLVEAIPAITYIDVIEGADTDTLGPTIYISPQVQRILGYSPEEWVADPGLWASLLHPDDRERRLAATRALFSGGRRMSDEYRLIARDGRVVWIQDESTIIADENGAPRFEQGVMLDITTRKEAEEALREAEAKFRTLVEAIPAITYIDVASDTNNSPTLYISPQVEPILGYSPEEWMADPELWMSSLHPDDREGVLEADQTSIANSSRLSLEYRLIARDGRVVWIQDESVIVTDENGVPCFEQGVMLDITARKEAEQAVTEAEAKYRALVERIPAIVYIGEYGEEGDWLYVSPQIERVLGYTPEEWLTHPHPMQSFTHPEDIAGVRDEEERAYGRGDAFHAEYRIRSKDGRWVWILDEAAPVLDESGRVLFMQGVMYDTTDRKQAEEELARALEKLRALDRLKNTLLHTLSHDLRSPLTAILGAASTLERLDAELPEDERAHLLHTLAARARGMNTLLTDLLDLDRLDQGIVEPRRFPVDLGELAHEVVLRTEALQGRQVDVDAGRVAVAVDAPKVERMLENLLSNAARHTPPDSHIWVRVTAEDGGAMLVVEDDGPGVPDDMKKAIFEAFQRGSDAAGLPGTGIGLSLVARFAELHGGRAWVEDRPGGGASFRVFLPNTGGA